MLSNLIAYTQLFLIVFSLVALPVVMLWGAPIMCVAVGGSVQTCGL